MWKCLDVSRSDNFLAVSAHDCSVGCSMCATSKFEVSLRVTLQSITVLDNRERGTAGLVSGFELDLSCLRVSLMLGAVAVLRQI